MKTIRDIEKLTDEEYESRKAKTYQYVSDYMYPVTHENMSAFLE